MRKAHALVVDDETDITELLSITLEQMDILTTTADCITEAKAICDKKHFDLCLTDMRLPDGDGIELVRYLQHISPQTPVAVITAHGNTESAVSALKSGAFDFVSKPVDLSVLRNLITSALELAHHSAPIINSDNELIGDSTAIRQVREMIQKVARGQAPVYISGESGVGKERVARLIHENSARHAHPFVPVNCGAIPSELMESEFFGHKKGSFTGAIQNKVGLFAAANGGTLFLDEIADLPMSMQVKLLRAIQEKTIRAVGAHQEQPIDVRILSATHQNLGDLVDKGLFRQDLYYRINVIELPVPKLSERQDDIPLLIEYFLQQLAHEAPITLEEHALEALSVYSFPGNVRELENILERAITLCDEQIIQTHDLGLLDTTEYSEPHETVRDSMPLVQRGFDLENHLAEIEKSILETALKQSKWNRTAAARQLGLSLRSLRYRMKKLGLE
jgi:two-component system, NtrC family, response regulator PilR